MEQRYNQLKGGYPPFALVQEAADDLLTRGHVIRLIAAALEEKLPPTLSEPASEEIKRWTGDVRRLVEHLEEADTQLRAHTAQHSDLVDIQLRR